MSEAIALAPYDADWPSAYGRARDEILDCLPAAPRLIEHIGSTAVPGLSAKPVIDIIVWLDDMAVARQAIPALAATGYEYRPDVSGPARIFLRRQRASDGQRTHHLHLHGDQDQVRRHLLFRDCLRADAALCRRYLALKHELAERFSHDREAYAKGKDGFVDAIVAAAGGPPRQPFWTN